MSAEGARAWMERGGSSTDPQEVLNATVPHRVGRTAIVKVLVAEDERFQREALAAVFNKANSKLAGQGVVQFELTQVASANAVVDMLAETTDWQLILLDVYMPDVCGTEILQAQF